MKKSDLDKLRALHDDYATRQKNAESRKEYTLAQIWEAKAVVVCEVLEALDGIPYTEAVDKIMGDDWR